MHLWHGTRLCALRKLSDGSKDLWAERRCPAKALFFWKRLAHDGAGHIFLGEEYVCGTGKACDEQGSGLSASHDGKLGDNDRVGVGESVGEKCRDGHEVAEGETVRDKGESEDGVRGVDGVGEEDVGEEDVGEGVGVRGEGEEDGEVEECGEEL